jgi:peptide/nickel transport system substrate-binding protein
MRRRSFLATAAAQLAMPALGGAAESRTLKFIPQADVAVVDPIWTTAYVTRNHAFMVWDTLYGQTGQEDGFKATPQMVEGHVISDDNKTWTLTLRDGLLFHTGEKVLARDCVASIQRWAVRDAFGQALMQHTDALTAPDDKTIVFRLNRPFAMLPDALGHSGSYMCAMMPERIARTDAFKQVSEIVGSGPFRFLQNERVPGSLVAYARFEQYQPRPNGVTDWTSGPKVVHFDRVEWRVVPDAETASAALQSGEVDWWETPNSDLIPLLRQTNGIAVAIKDPTGDCRVMRPNHLYPPFDNPEIRRALMGAIDQNAFMTAMAGTDTTLWRTPCGFFSPGTPMASSTASSPLPKEAPDFDRVKAALKAAGYKGEKVVLLAGVDSPQRKAMSDVTADTLQQAGIDVDYQAMDWGTVVQRRASAKPPAEGGWNLFCTGFTGLDLASPAVDLGLRGNGKKGWFGWPDSPKLESLRNDWFEAPDLAAQQRIAIQMQDQAFIDVPYYPLGFAYQPVAFRSDIENILDGFVLFWNVRRG